MISKHRGRPRLFRAAVASTVAAALGLGLALVGVSSASAHTPTVSTTCSVLTVRGTAYETKPGTPEQSHIKVTPAVYKTQWKYTLHGGRDFIWLDSDTNKYTDAAGNAYTPVKGDKTPYYERTQNKRQELVTPEQREKVVDKAAVPADPTPNTVTVTIDGVQVASDKFGTSYSNTFNYSDQYTAHNYTVSFVGWTGVGTRSFSGTTTPCVRPDVPVSGTPTVTITPPTCDAPYNTLSYDIPEGLSINGFTGKGSLKVEDYPGSFKYGIETTEKVTVEKGYKYDGPATITFGPAVDPGTLDCRPLDATATVKIITAEDCTANSIPAVEVENATLVGELDTTPGDHEVKFTANDGHKFADGTTETTVKYTVTAAIGNQTADPNAPCFNRPEQPEPKVDVSEWVDGQNDCTVDTITQTQTTSTVNYVWNEDTKQYDAQKPVVTTETRTREKTADEVKECTPVVTPPTSEAVTPLPPTFNDLCGTDKDDYTLPDDTDAVSYTVEDHTTSEGVRTVTVIAQAEDGYILEDVTDNNAKVQRITWEHQYTNEPCDTGTTPPPTGEPTPPVTTPPTNNTPAPTCDTVGAVNIPKTSPLYNTALDSDKDGVACESTTSTVNKTPAAAPPVKAATTTGQLAYTGSEGLKGVLVIALVLLAAGIWIVIDRRIRNRKS